jgi:hypothetical protein
MVSSSSEEANEYESKRCRGSGQDAYKDLRNYDPS